MAQGAKQTDDLEERVSTAHRSYIDALRALERAEHIAVCDRCGDPLAMPQMKLEAVQLADREKEMRRGIFRDLVDALGYVPSGGPSIGDTAFRCSDTAATASGEETPSAKRLAMAVKQLSGTRRPH